MRGRVFRSGGEAYFALAIVCGYGADSGPSRGAPSRRALRPIEASKAAVCWVRFTSTPAVHFAQIAAVRFAGLISLSRPFHASFQLGAKCGRRGARLHRHHEWRQRGKNRPSWARVSLRATAARADQPSDLALRVDRVNLKDSLRQIQTNPAAKFRIDLPMDGFPSDGVSTTTILAR
jgi:hypothetical protein